MLLSELLNYLHPEEVSELDSGQHSDSVKSSEGGCDRLWATGRRDRRERRGRKEGGKKRERERTMRNRRLGLRYAVALMRASKDDRSTVGKYNLKKKKEDRGNVVSQNPVKECVPSKDISDIKMLLRDTIKWKSCLKYLTKRALTGGQGWLSSKTNHVAGEAMGEA